MADKIEGTVVLDGLFEARLPDAPNAEQALRREEERSRMYLDMAGVILLALDREGRVVLANPKTCSVLEGEEGDIIGKDWIDSFIPERERGKVRKVFQQLMSGTVEPAEYVENQVVTLEGNIRWVAWHNKRGFCRGTLRTSWTEATAVSRS